jgi:hypothetical protein
LNDIHYFSLSVTAMAATVILFVDVMMVMVMQVISFDKMGLRRLQHIMGNALSPIIGQYDGYYDLNLSIENDRICLTKLLMQAEHSAKVNKGKCSFGTGRTNDLSQNGDWSCFRNEIIGGKAGHISTELFNPMPHYGQLCFDFCGANKAPREALVIKDSRCISVITNLSLVTRAQQDDLMEELGSMQEQNAEDVFCDGRFTPYNNKRSAEDLQLCMCKFYSRLGMRSQEYAKALKLEEVKFALDGAIVPVVPEVGEEEAGDSDDSSDSLSHVVYEDDEMEEVAILVQWQYVLVIMQM